MIIPNLNENEPVTLLKICKYANGTQEREVLENYLITESSKLITFEIVSKDKIHSELN